jgi:hypothetical protein
MLCAFTASHSFESKGTMIWMSNLKSNSFPFFSINSQEQDSTQFVFLDLPSSLINGVITGYVYCIWKWAYSWKSSAFNVCSFEMKGHPTYTSVFN